jgi:hypothetical protein
MRLRHTHAIDAEKFSPAVELATAGPPVPKSRRRDVHLLVPLITYR